MSAESYFVLAVAGTAVFMDFLMERVINSFICLGLLLGLALSLRSGGIGGVPVYAAGVLIRVFCFSLCFIFICWGQVTLRSLPCWVELPGIYGILHIILGAFFLGAVLSLAFLISCGNLRERISYFIHYFYQYFVTGQSRPYIRKGKQVENFHFTVPILLSVMLYAGGFY